MLPADITGGNIFDESTRSFVFMKGPLFTNLVMADELNRASAKSQSAFLQAMEENSVSVDGETYPLASPFVVIATQNSLDSAGTNALPESQLDRFMMSISLGLPGRDSEKRLLMEPPRKDLIDGLTPVLSRDGLISLRDEVSGVHAGDRVAEYILDLVAWIRERAHGLSPRTVLALTACSRAWAFGEGRDFIMPSDVKAVASAVLCHRLTVFGSSGFQNSGDLVDAAQKNINSDG
jgi:MoxR-like ATPase